jgi:hypothetical protein
VASREIAAQHPGFLHRVHASVPVCRVRRAERVESAKEIIGGARLGAVD